MKSIAMVVTVGLSLTACYGSVSPSAERAMITRDYTALRDPELCAAYEDNRRCANAPLCAAPRDELTRVAAEINRRNLISAADWADVEAGRVRNGMRGFCAPLAAWGKPLFVNESGAFGAMVWGGGRTVGFQGDRVSSVTAPVR
jgi:hypothetical protein